MSHRSKVIVRRLAEGDYDDVKQRKAFYSNKVSVVNHHIEISDKIAQSNGCTDPKSLEIIHIYLRRGRILLEGKLTLPLMPARMQLGLSGQTAFPVRK